MSNNFLLRLKSQERHQMAHNVVNGGDTQLQLPVRSRSPRLSMQSTRTESTVVTQIWDPQSSANASKRHTLNSLPIASPQPAGDDFSLEPEPEAEAGMEQASEGWEFLETKPTPQTGTSRVASPTTPNFSRPFGVRRNDTYPSNDGYFRASHAEYEDSISSSEPATVVNPGSSGNSSRRSGSTSRSASSTNTKSSKRRDRYSTKSMFMGASSETSSRARTVASDDAEEPLMRYHDGAASPVHHEQTKSPSKTKPGPAIAQPQIRVSSTPESRAESRQSTNSDVFSDEQEPTLEMGDIDQLSDVDEAEEYDEHNNITVFPAYSPSRPASFESAAEPPPVIKDRRLLNSNNIADPPAVSDIRPLIAQQPPTKLQKKRPRFHNDMSPLREVQSPDSSTASTQSSRTDMSSLPEVKRSIEQRPSMPGRRWSASNFDTSSLSAEKIEKLKKKGINPALYLEMQSARSKGKKGRFKLPPLIGNTFLGG